MYGTPSDYHRITTTPIKMLAYITLDYHAKLLEHCLEAIELPGDTSTKISTAIGQTLVEWPHAFDPIKCPIFAHFYSYHNSTCCK